MNRKQNARMATKMPWETPIEPHWGRKFASPEKPLWQSAELIHPPNTRRVNFFLSK
jgi:hypothetical protein